MNKPYNWKTSRDAFEAFKLIYKNPDISLTELTDVLKLKKNTVSQRLKELKNIGLVDEKYKKRQKIFWANTSKFYEILGFDDKRQIDIELKNTWTFEALIESCKGKIKGKLPGYINFGAVQTAIAPETVNVLLLEKLRSENNKLRQEIVNLKRILSKKNDL